MKNINDFNLIKLEFLAYKIKLKTKFNSEIFKSQQSRINILTTLCVDFKIGNIKK